MRLQSGQVMAALTSAVTVPRCAPALSSSSAMFCQPLSSATCSAVRPLLSLASRSAPDSISSAGISAGGYL